MSLLYNQSFDAFLAAFAGAQLSRLHVDFITPSTGRTKGSQKACFFCLMWHLHLVGFCFSIALRRSAKAARIQAANQSALSTMQAVPLLVLYRGVCVSCVCVLVFVCVCVCVHGAYKSFCVYICTHTHMYVYSFNRISENSRLLLPRRRRRHQEKAKDTKRKVHTHIHTQTIVKDWRAVRDERRGTFGYIFKQASQLPN